jgi:hypothetical protein
LCMALIGIVDCDIGDKEERGDDPPGNCGVVET